MIGSTPIPPGAGQTITGAITNLYNGMDTDELAGWTLVKTYNPVSGWSKDTSSDIMSIFTQHKKFLSVAGWGNLDSFSLADYKIHDLDRLYSNGFPLKYYFFTHMYSTNCMACAGWTTANDFEYTSSNSNYKLLIYVKN